MKPRSTHLRSTALALCAFALSACGGGAPSGDPSISASARASARWQVDLHRVLDGIYRVYGRRCIDSVRVGHTVEFRNYNPEVASNVTAIDAPETDHALYSPNLVRPYNYEEVGEEAYSYWRYTFTEPGTYDYIDTHSTAPGRKVVDNYYGTVTFVGIDPNAPFGTICVRDADGNGCDAVCCQDDEDCESGQHCYRTEVDSVGRCLSPSG